jgi:hypothetical protein
MRTPFDRAPVIVLASASALLAACVEQRETMAPELSPAAVVVAAAPGLPNATYAMTLVPEDFPPLFPPEVIDLLAGDWELDLNDPRTVFVRLNGEIVVVGRYTSNPARLVMRDVGGPLACVDEPGMATGVYEWTLDNGELTLAAVQDRCEGRPFVLTVRPWQMQ